MPSYTIVLHTDGLYYIADQSKDDYVSHGFLLLKDAAAELREMEYEEEDWEDA